MRMGRAKSYLDIRTVRSGKRWRWMVGADIGNDEFDVLRQGEEATREAAREAAVRERRRLMTVDSGWRKREIMKRRVYACAPAIARRLWAYDGPQRVEPHEGDAP